MATTTLHLIRHGEPESWGEDPALTELGRRQATEAGSRLRSVDAPQVLHSSRRRAVETAEIVARMLNVASTASGLAEDLTPIPEDWTIVPSRYHKFLRAAPSVEHDIGGARLDAAFDEFGRVGQVDRNMVMVTHNFVIGWFVRRTLDAPWRRWIGLNSDHAAISTIRWTTGIEPRLLRFNDHGPE